MDRADLEAELSYLVDQMEGEQGDRHEIYLRLRQVVQQLQATGMPVPSDLAEMLRDLESEFDADRAGSPEEEHPEKDGGDEDRRL